LKIVESVGDDKGKQSHKTNHEGAQTQWKRAPSVRLLQPERRKIDRKIGMGLKKFTNLCNVDT
jgi:hypothetical protein